MPRSRSRSRSRERRSSPHRRDRGRQSDGRHRHEDSRREERRGSPTRDRPGHPRHETSHGDHDRSQHRDRSRDRGRSRSRDRDTGRGGQQADRGRQHGQQDRSRSREAHRRDWGQLGGAAGQRSGDDRYAHGSQQPGGRDRDGRREDRNGGGQVGRDRGGGGGGRGRSRDERHGGGGKEQWGRPEDQPEQKAPDVVVQPIMELSGKLAAETNQVNGTVLKYQPPPDASTPDKKWRMYVFKGDALAEEDPLYLHRQDSCMFGRDKRVVDVLCAHPSISKQHAVLQFRKTSKPDEFGLDQVAIRPYLMDLGTVNGTFLNGERIESERYYELLPKDVIKFGLSTRDYVLLYEEITRGL